MDLGWFGGSDAPTLDAAVTRAREARDAGFGTFWFPQVVGLDALVLERISRASAEAPARA